MTHFRSALFRKSGVSARRKFGESQRSREKRANVSAMRLRFLINAKPRGKTHARSPATGNAGAKKAAHCGRHCAISISEAQNKRLGRNFRVRHQRVASLLYRALRRVVGCEQQPRPAVALAGALHESFYRNPRVGKYPRYRRQNAGFIGDLQADVELSGNLVERRRASVLRSRYRERFRFAHNIFDGVVYVGYHGA